MAQKIPFMKLSGAGNDFVIIDNRADVVQYENTDFVEKVCQRRMSAGADGVLLVENTDKADFRMRYFNADGGEAETCGNGARCISRFAYINGIVSERMSFETQAGIYESEIVGTDVKVRMSDPTDLRLNFPLQLEDGVHNISFANSGVPHVLFYAEDLEGNGCVRSWAGRRVTTTTSNLRGQTPILFVSIILKRLTSAPMSAVLKMKPSLVVQALLPLRLSLLRLGKVQSPVAVKTASGSVLTIHFDLVNGEPENVYLEGDARIIYSGELTEDAWAY